MSRHQSRTGTPGTKPLLSVSEAALLLGVDRSTLYRAIRQGQAPSIPTARVGRRMRIPRRAIERLLAGELGKDANQGTDESPGHCPTCGTSLVPSSEVAEDRSLTFGSPIPRTRRGQIALCPKRGPAGII